jgi:hypothetical protein
MNKKVRWIVERRLYSADISEWNIQYKIILPVEFYGNEIVEFYELDATTGELIKLCTIHPKKSAGELRRH